MQTRQVALILGVIYVVVGVAGFVPALAPPAPPDAPALTVTSGYAYLFGLFPVNLVHDLVHLAVGIWGIAAYASSFAAARVFARSLAVIFGVLTVMGFFPGLRTTFGLAPLFGHDVWLHALTALVSAYFGWRPRAAELAEERFRRAA